MFFFHSTEKEKEIAKSQQRTEEIFALPCLRMDLKTKHVQGEALPTPDDPKPIVDCTFVTGELEADAKKLNWHKIGLLLKIHRFWPILMKFGQND